MIVIKAVSYKVSMVEPHKLKRKSKNNISKTSLILNISLPIFPNLSDQNYRKWNIITPLKVVSLIINNQVKQVKEWLLLDKNHSLKYGELL
jgi:hypothetical protein